MGHREDQIDRNIFSKKAELIYNHLLWRSNSLLGYVQGTNFVIAVLRPDSGIRIHWREGHLIRPCYEHLGNLETKTAQKLLGTDSAGVPRLMLVPSPTHYWSEMPNNNILGLPSSFGFLCYIIRKKLEHTFWPTQYIHLICWHESFVLFSPL